MPSTHFTLKEEEVIKLLLEFLSNRELSISQLSLERETGVVNETFSDYVLFLRQLILDGQWDDVLEFVQPLEGIESFDSKQFHYIVIKHKYIELLCIRSETGIFQNVDVAVEEIVKCLADLEKYCPSKKDYNNLCLLVTLPKLSDHFDYQQWNPSNARVNCFKAIFPLVEKLLTGDKKGESNTAKGDRLIQLIVKGVLYESCVQYCQQRIRSPLSKKQEVCFSNMLNGNGFSDSDLSLLSWLQCIPPETFFYPFEHKTLSVDVEQLDKPSLEASWTEQILVTPIKPKIFPHSAMRFKRLETSDFKSKFLATNIDTLSHRRHSMPYSMGDLSMSRSNAGFHLTGKKALNTSVDLLFEDGAMLSTSCTDLQSELDMTYIPSKNKFTVPPKIIELVSPKTEDHALVKKDDTAKDSAADDNSLKSTATETSKAQHNKISEKQQLVTGNSMSNLRKEFQQKQTLKKAQNEMSNTGCVTTTSSVSHDSPAASTYEQNIMPSNIGVTNIEIPLPCLGGEVKTKGSGKIFISTPKPSKSGSLTPEIRWSQTITGNDDSRSLDCSVFLPFSSDPVPISAPASLKSGASEETRTVPLNSPKNGPVYSVDLKINYSPVQKTASSSKLDRNQNKCSPVPSTQIPVQPQIKQIRRNWDSCKKKTPNFIPVTILEDAQAIRAAEFHPSGQLYAVGSSSKTLRICAYANVNDLRQDHVAHQPTVLYKKVKHHKGSIYCLAWSPTGELLATGSNDKTVKLMKFNMKTCNVDSNEAELTMHDGTVRDMCFIKDTTSRSSLLISGGAEDCKIYVTDCDTATPFQTLSGHSGHILSLYTWAGEMFVSGSQDGTIRFWDLRTKGCVHLVTPPPLSGSGKGTPVTTVCVDPHGRLLVSGQEDASCMLYDIRGGRLIQNFRPHTSDIRTARFSPQTYYLLTGSYDHKVVLTDLQGDLTQPLPMIVAAEHSDRVIQGKWHPKEYAFLTTSADKTATLWALPLH